MMKIKRAFAAVMIFVLTFCLCSCSRQGEKTESAAETMAENVEKFGAEKKASVEARFEKYMKDSGVSGAVYAVYKGEEIVSYGRGDAADGVKNSPDAAYGIASLTKQFTAAGILRLYEQGKLDINDKLSKYFPDYAYGDKITLSQLLSHRSGIPDYEVNTYSGRIIISCEGEYEDYAEVFVENSAEENIKIIRDFYLSRELLFEPGEHFNYSDSNFGLLAEIIAKVSGESYHDYIRKEFFEKLGMDTAAFIDDHDGLKAQIAATDRSEFSIDYYTVKGAEYGCGDILASEKDLYKWYKALFGGRVLSVDSLELMTTNYSKAGEAGYGMGLMIDEGETPTYYHFGFIPSYYSAVVYLPEADYFQVLLSNRADGYPQQVAVDMARYFGSTIGLKIFSAD